MGNGEQSSAAEAVEQPRLRRTAPLPLRIGQAEVLLLAAEVELLLDAVGFLRVTIDEAARRAGRPSPHEVIAQLDELAGLLHSSAVKLSDEPFAPTVDQTRLLRQALADLVGYHRTDLPNGLRNLRKHLG